MRNKVSLVVICSLLISLLLPSFILSAEMSTQEKFEVLKAVKVMNGVEDGSAGMNLPIDRAQLAAILVRIYKLPLITADQGFADVPRNHWAQKEGVIGAVVRAGYMQGTGDNPKRFSPNQNLTYAELAVVLARALHLKLDGQMPGAPSWAAAEIKAVVDAGLMRVRFNYQETATRADLIEAAYALYMRSILIGSLSVNDVKITGTKSMKVTFNQAVNELYRLQFTLKKGGTNVYFSTTYPSSSEVILNSSNKWPAGDYTLMVAYNSVSLGIFNLTIENERIGYLSFENQALTLMDEIKGVAKVTIKNQYGEVINNTSLGKNLNWSAYPSSSIDKSKIGEGLLYITYGTKSNTAPGSQLKDLTKVVVSISENSNLLLTQELQVIKSNLGVSTIKWGSLRDKEGKSVDLIQANVGVNYTLDYTATDPYGIRVTNYDLVNNGTLQLINSQPEILSVGIVKGSDNVAIIQLTVKKSVDATVNLTGYSSLTGKADTKQIVMKKMPAKLTKFIINGTAKEAIAGERVEIRFTALDQNGNSLTRYEEIKGDVNILASNGIITEERASDGSYRLYVLFNQSGRQYLTANVGAEISNLYIDVKAGVEYRSVKIEAEQGTTMINGIMQKVKIKAVDQYGREKLVTGPFENYSIEVTTNDPDFPVVQNNEGYYLSPSPGKTGQATLVATLKNEHGQVIDTATMTINIVAKEDVTRFTLQGLDRTIYASGRVDAYSTQLDVQGMLSNGTSVYLGARSVEYIQSIQLVNSSAFILDTPTYKIYATKEGSTQVNVILEAGPNNTITLTGNLRSSSSAPVAKKITGLNPTMKYNLTKGLNVLDANLFSILDSYGVDSVMKPIYVNISSSNLMDITKNKKVIAFVDANNSLQFQYEDHSPVSSSSNVEGQVQLNGSTHNGLTAMSTLTIQKN